MVLCFRGLRMITFRGSVVGSVRLFCLFQFRIRNTGMVNVSEHFDENPFYPVNVLECDFGIHKPSVLQLTVNDVVY